MESAKLATSNRPQSHNLFLISTRAVDLALSLRQAITRHSLAATVLGALLAAAAAAIDLPHRRRRCG
jgi:hypothetical protein